MKRALLYILITITFTIGFSSNGFSSPSITGVPSEISNNSQVTITGSGFGVKPQAAPLIWDDFESGVPGNIPLNPVVGANWERSDSGSPVRYSNSIARAGKMSARADFVTPGNYRSALAVKNGNWGSLYISWWYRADYGNLYGYTVPTSGYKFPCRNFKILRLEGNNGSKTGDQHEGVPLVAYEKRLSSTGSYPSGTFATALRAQYSPTVQSGDFYGSSVGWDHQTWNHVEIYVNVIDGQKEYKMWENGRDVSPSKSSKQWTDLWSPYMGADNSRFNEILLGLYFARDGDTSAYVYLDDVYIDTTMARVVIGNAPSFEASTHRENQVPVSWSDKNITISTNQGTFPSGAQAYLFVIDSNGVPSAGHPISFGGSTTTPPTPIDNIPGITISTPSTTGNYLTPSPTITIGGSTVDDNGISDVTWSTTSGGSGSAENISGDWSSWQISNLGLVEGNNVVTITATDTIGQTSSEVITVNYSPTLPAPEGSMVWNANLQTGDNTWSNSTVTYTARLLIKGSSIAQGGTQISLGFQGRDSGTYAIRKVSIAERDINAAIGDVVDSTWTKVTFDGNSTSTWATDVTTIPPGQEKFSDPIAFTLKPGSDYYVTFKIDSPSVYLSPPADYKELYFQDIDRADDIDWSNNGHGVTQDYHALGSIFASGPALTRPSPPSGLRLVSSY